MRASPRRVLLAALAVLAACSGDDGTDGFRQSDLAGRWRYTVFYAGPTVATGAPGWIRGTMSVDAAGLVTLESFADSVGNTTIPSVPPITYAIDSGGVVTATTTAFASAHGKMNPGKDFFAVTATQGTGPAARVRFGLYQKIASGTAYGAPDVAGAAFAYRQLASGVGPTWERGRVTVDATGLYSLSDRADPTGPQADVPDQGTLSVDADGVVATTAAPSFAGFLSADKETMIGTQTSAPNDHRLTALVRAGATFSQADLAGTWHYLNVAVADGSLGYAAAWAHGTVTFDAGGAGTFGPQVDSGGGSGTPPPIVLAVGADGTVTQTDPAPSVFNGVLGPARDVMFATETHEAGVYGIILAIR